MKHLSLQLTCVSASAYTLTTSSVPDGLSIIKQINYCNIHEFPIKWTISSTEMNVGVVWHIGKVLACSSVGLGSNPGSARGFCTAYSVLYQDGTLLHARRVGLVLVHFPFIKATSQWLYVSLICQFNTSLCRFSRGTHTKSRIPSIFLVLVSCSVCTKPAWLLKL